MASEYKQKSVAPQKRAVRRKALPDHEAELAPIQPSRHSHIQRLQSLVGNRQIQRMIAAHQIQRGVVDDVVNAVVDTSVKIFNAAVEATTAYKLWIGEGNKAADWQTATEIEKNRFMIRPKFISIL